MTYGQENRNRPRGNNQSLAETISKLQEECHAEACGHTATDLLTSPDDALRALIQKAADQHFRYLLPAGFTPVIRISQLDSSIETEAQAA